MTNVTNDDDIFAGLYDDDTNTEEPEDVVDEVMDMSPPPPDPSEVSDSELPDLLPAPSAPVNQPAAPEPPAPPVVNAAHQRPLPERIAAIERRIKREQDSEDADQDFLFEMGQQLARLKKHVAVINKVGEFKALIGTLNEQHGKMTGKDPALVGQRAEAVTEKDHLTQLIEAYRMKVKMLNEQIRLIDNTPAVETPESQALAVRIVGLQEQAQRFIQGLAPSDLPEDGTVSYETAKEFHVVKKAAPTGRPGRPRKSADEHSNGDGPGEGVQVWSRELTKEFLTREVQEEGEWVPVAPRSEEDAMTMEQMCRRANASGVLSIDYVGPDGTPAPGHLLPGKTVDIMKTTNTKRFERGFGKFLTDLGWSMEIVDGSGFNEQGEAVPELARYFFIPR